MNITKYRLKFSTFFRKKLPKIDDQFGVYFVTGKQGSGKTYYAIYMLSQQDPKKINKVYTNIKSLNIPNFNICYFEKITDIYFNEDKHCVFVIDEVSRKYNKNSSTDTQFYAFLNQCRKNQRIVILITQEWLELPLWIRRPAKIMITTKKTALINKLGFFTSNICDGENVVFDKDLGDYIAPPIQIVVYKRTLKVAKYYDTFEVINSL